MTVLSDYNEALELLIKYETMMLRAGKPMPKSITIDSRLLNAIVKIDGKPVWHEAALIPLQKRKRYTRKNSKDWVAA